MGDQKRTGQTVTRPLRSNKKHHGLYLLKVEKSFDQKVPTPKKSLMSFSNVELRDIDRKSEKRPVNE